MTDPERLERYLDDFGERLGSAAAAALAARGRPRSRPRRVVLALCGCAVAAVVVAVVLGAGGQRLDPVAEARAALGAPGEIVYMKITSETTAPTSNTVPPPRTTEQWSALDPLRWRYVQTIPRRGGMGDIQGQIVGRVEISYGDGVLRNYIAARDTLTATSGYRDDEPAARLPSLLGLGGGDPQADLRSMLTDAEVTDAGEQRIGGRTVRRFVSVRQRAEARSRLRMVLDVDPVTFAPLQGTISHSFHGDAPRAVTHLRVDDYRRIALTGSTRRLLEIQTTPRTRVTQDTAAEQRERVRVWRAACRPLKNGNMACPAPGPALRAP